MQKQPLISWLLLASLLLTITAASPSQGEQRFAPTGSKIVATIDPRLLTSSGSSIGYFALMRQQANLQVGELGWQARGDAVYQRLTAATSSQAAVAARLQGLQSSGAVQSYRAYWIVNAFYVVGDTASIAALSQLPEVAALVPAGRQRLVAPRRVARPDTAEWNISLINAPQVWAQGDRGAGVTIGDINTGAIASHPALTRQYRGTTILPGNNYNWYDAVGGSSVPLDDNGVGTHSLGVALGEDASQTNQIGVAPAADWIACKAFDSSGYGQDADILTCMQWMLAPTDLSGNNPRPDLRPRIANNGWGAADGANQTYRAAVQAWLAAGILPVFNAGDTLPGQPSCTVNAPGSYPESFTVGASDISDNIAQFSCTGPSPIGQSPKPQMVAPGVAVRSSVPSGSCYLCDPSQYVSYDGTGVAASHASGVAALLLGRNPALTPTQLTWIMTSTAHFSPTWGVQPNDSYGWGRLDALAAYNAAPAPGGMVVGRISDGTNGIGGAVISAAQGGNPLFVNTADASGYYTLSVSPASYNLTASAYGYYSQTVSAINVPNGITFTQNFTLSASTNYSVNLTLNGPTGPTNGTLSVDGTPYQNVPVTDSYSPSLPAGNYLARFYPADRCYAYVTATLTVPTAQTVNITSPYRQDAAGYTCSDTYPYSWLPGIGGPLTFANRNDGAIGVNLPFAFVYYGNTYTALNVTTNGNIQFSSANTSGMNIAIPSPAAPNNALYPFWDDLTMVNQGNVYTAVSGAEPHRRFVVEWRDVQHNDNVQPYGDYTFEVILDQSSNAITFQYNAMSGDDSNGDSATIGTEGASSIGLQYSFDAPAISSTQAIRFTAPSYPPPPTPTDCANPFVDISGNVFYGAIHYLYCRSVVNGADSSHYSPGGTSTRGQFAKVVVLGFAITISAPPTPSFTDVPPSYFAYAYIESGKAAGILSGFDADSCAAANAAYPCYLPNRPITRGQLTKLVVNAAQYPLVTPGGQTFSDVPPSNVFYLAIETAHAHGVINGYPNGTFLPNANIRRDAMAQIVYKGITSP